MKICTGKSLYTKSGQNTLLNVLLKMRTNLDFNPDQMLQNLTNI